MIFVNTLKPTGGLLTSSQFLRSGEKSFQLELWRLATELVSASVGGKAVSFYAKDRASLISTMCDTVAVAARDPRMAATGSRVCESHGTMNLEVWLEPTLTGAPGSCYVSFIKATAYPADASTGPFNFAADFGGGLAEPKLDPKRPAYLQQRPMNFAPFPEWSALTLISNEVVDYTLAHGAAERVQLSLGFDTSILREWRSRDFDNKITFSAATCQVAAVQWIKDPDGEEDDDFFTSDVDYVPASHHEISFLPQLKTVPPERNLPLGQLVNALLR